MEKRSLAYRGSDLHRPAILITAALLALPAWAINKCTDAAGKVSYQDEKCPAGKSEELKITGNATHADGGAYGGYGTASGGSSSGGSGAVHTGPRGGRYTIGASGNKNYIPRK